MPEPDFGLLDADGLGAASLPCAIYEWALPSQRLVSSHKIATGGNLFLQTTGGELQTPGATAGQEDWVRVDIAWESRPHLCSAINPCILKITCQLQIGQLPKLSH